MLNIGDSVQIAGCSTKKRLLEASSGCDSFDTLLGGAIVNSSIVLIDEYRSRSYGSYLLRSFLAEGIHYGHRCFIADPTEDPKESILKVIPSRKTEDDQKKEIPNSSMSNIETENSMKIAWRYGNVKQVSSAIGPSGNENLYDFSKHVENPKVEVYNDEIPSLSGLYKRLCDVVREEEAHTKSSGRGGPKKNLLRVILKNIDMEIWEDHQSLGRFLCSLRSLARSSYMIVYITANSYRVSTSTWRLLESSSDTQIQLIPFNETEKKMFRHLGTAHGYFHLKNLPRLMSVGTHTPPILDLIFEASSKKGFQIRVMHLPPAFDEPAPGQQNTATASCQNIDF
uniref:Elongator complex protein 4 n=1 Tax=Caenorhabditis tropicalis TaxID=1561998 RepID=A0A1I7SY06_9PELO